MEKGNHSTEVRELNPSERRSSTNPSDRHTVHIVNHQPKNDGFLFLEMKFIGLERSSQEMIRERNQDYRNPLYVN